MVVNKGVLGWLCWFFYVWGNFNLLVILWDYFDSFSKKNCSSLYREKYKNIHTVIWLPFVMKQKKILQFHEWLGFLNLSFIEVFLSLQTSPRVLTISSNRQRILACACTIFSSSIELLSIPHVSFIYFLFSGDPTRANSLLSIFLFDVDRLRIFYDRSTWRRCRTMRGFLSLSQTFKMQISRLRVLMLNSLLDQRSRSLSHFPHFRSLAHVEVVRVCNSRMFFWVTKKDKIIQKYVGMS